MREGIRIRMLLMEATVVIWSSQKPRKLCKWKSISISVSATVIREVLEHIWDGFSHYISDTSDSEAGRGRREACNPDVLCRSWESQESVGWSEWLAMGGSQSRSTAQATGKLRVGRPEQVGGHGMLIFGSLGLPAAHVKH